MTQKLLVFCQYAKWLVVELDTFLRRELASTAATEPVKRDAAPAAGADPIDFYAQVEQYEVELIVWALKRTAGHQRKAADLLNVKETTLHSKIKRYKIDVEALLPSGVTGIR